MFGFGATNPKYTNDPDPVRAHAVPGAETRQRHLEDTSKPVRKHLEDTSELPSQARKTYLLADRSTIEHAKALLDYLQENECGMDSLLRYPDIRRIYDEMLDRLRWRRRPWQSVSRQFDLLTTGGNKPSVYLPDDISGRFVPTRVYPVPRRAEKLQVIQGAAA